MTRFEVVHRTTYTYNAPVSMSYGEAHLMPRSAPGQTVVTSAVTVDPTPADLSERTDFFGNRVTYFQLDHTHTQLVVTASSTVDVHASRGDLPLVVDQPWEAVRDQVQTMRGDEAAEAHHHLLDSPAVFRSPPVDEFTAPSFTPGRPVLDAVGDLVHRVHTSFRFDPAATDVSSTIEDLFDARAGVCQDFAHLVIACLRHVGLPARYVSGYLETAPPVGMPKLQGVDASHAWASVLLPGFGWVDIDPTNDQFVDDRYVTVGWGRDYTDIAPLRGVVFSDSTSTTLTVNVDVIRVA